MPTAVNPCAALRRTKHEGYASNPAPQPQHQYCDAAEKPLLSARKVRNPPVNPLNQDESGRRSFGAALRQRMMQDFRDAHRSAGGDRLKPASALAERSGPPVREPFDTVEFDAHRLDLRLTIRDQDPYGEEQIIEI
jgi:hypothetical protein